MWLLDSFAPVLYSEEQNIFSILKLSIAKRLALGDALKSEKSFFFNRQMREKNWSTFDKIICRRL